MPDETLLYYTGLLAVPSRPASALESLLADYFDVPVQVEQFVGGWYPLAAAEQCRLGEDEEDASDQVGLGAVVGDEVWHPQSGIRIRLGPLSKREYDRVYLVALTGYGQKQDRDRALEEEGREWKVRVRRGHVERGRHERFPEALERLA